MLCKQVQNEKYCYITIQNELDGEFENQYFENFGEENDILHNFSSFRTPQQNDVVEKRTC